MKYLLIFTLFLASCATQKNADKFYNNHPDALAAKCADKFPVRDSTAPVVIDSSHRAENENYQRTIDSLKYQADFLQGEINNIKPGDVNAETYLKLQQVQAKADQLNKELTKLKNGYKPCLPDTVYKSTTVYRENTARVASQASTITSQNEQIKDLKKGITWRNWVMIGEAVLLVIAAFIIKR